MSLSFDTARCTAHKPYGIPAVPCRDCQRYTETVHHEYRQSWMRPVPIINNVCATRIAPEGEKKMKMAKASTADIEMAMELSRFVEDLVDGMCPKQACADPESDDIEWLEDDPDQQHIKIITALQDIARKGSIFRVTFGMSVLIDPRNELIDPEADTLEPHPKIGILADQVEALTAERDEWKARCEFSFEQRDKLTAERDALKDAARLALDALNTCETEGEQVRYSTYDTESVGSAIAALKAVL